MTVMVILSVDTFRVKYYEVFYVCHIITVPLTIIFSALHFPTIAWWCWSALLLWIAERLYRSVRWLYVNGFFGKAKVSALPYRGGTPPSISSGGTATEKKSASPRKSEWDTGGVRQVTPTHTKDISLPFDSYGRNRNSLPRDYSQDSWQSEEDGYPSKRGSAGTTGSGADLLPHSPTSAKPLMISTNPTYPPTSGALLRANRVPPAGYAFAQLLPGRVVRLRLLTPRPIIWAPGQHVLLLVPLVSKFTTHPFTISGCYDGDTETGEGRVIELLVRAKNGFTKELWDTIAQLTTSATNEYPFKVNDPERGVLAEKSGHGALIRAYVDGPFGSSIRAHWGNHSTVLIVTGGTGVTFGVSILEYLAMCMAGRDGQTLGGRPGGWGAQGFRTTRIRFIWLVREFCEFMQERPRGALTLTEASLYSPHSVVCNCSSAMLRLGSSLISTSRYLRIQFRPQE